MNRKLAGGLSCIVVAALFAACGGGGSTSNPTTPGGPAATAPTITTQPVNAAGTVGSTATFTVVAAGTTPLTYQWQKNGTAIPGASAASYTTPALQIGDDGAMFAVVVTNSAGTVTSSSAKLSITAQPASGPSPADVVTFKNDA